jgi:uncharacterized membrane protein
MQEAVTIPSELLPRLVDLSGSELNLYLVILIRADHGAKITRRALKDATGYSTATIIRGTDTLVSRGLITKQTAQREGCRLPTTFTVTEAQ